MTNAKILAAIPNIADPIRAINYALDECDGDDFAFLETWRARDWHGIRTHWPVYLERCAQVNGK